MSFFVSLGFLSIGLWLFYWAWRQDKLLQLSHHWPQANAKIIVSEIIEAKLHQDESPTLSFLYTFQVNGQVYTGEKINHFELENKMDLEEMQSFVRQYPAQAQIQVTHHPEDPTNCVLLADNTQGKTSAKALGAILLGLGTLTMWLTWL